MFRYEISCDIIIISSQKDIYNAGVVVVKNFTDKNAITVIQLNTSYNYNGEREGYARVLNMPKRKATTAKNN